MHDFTMVNYDTDSIMFCKKDQTPFTEDQQRELLTELNSLFPEKIKFEHDGVFKFVAVLKAKNYILDDGKKIKKKGSGLKDQKRAKAIQNFFDEIINAMVSGRENYTEIYEKYVRAILKVTDIKEWCTKKTYTETVNTSQRTNETKLLDILKGTDYRVGDKVWTYFKPDKTLGLAENFDGVYDEMHLLKNLFTSTKIFANVIDIKSTFVNYSLKGNRKNLEKFFHTKDFHDALEDALNGDTE